MVIGEEEESLVGKAFQKHNPAGDWPLRSGGRQSHRIDFPPIGQSVEGTHSLKPFSELIYRVAFHPFSLKRSHAIGFSEFMEGNGLVRFLPFLVDGMSRFGQGGRQKDWRLRHTAQRIVSGI